MKETRTIDGIEYRVLLRRVPTEEKKNVRNRRTTKSNGTHENTSKQKKATKKESQSPNNGETSTRTKKVSK
jgi:hypothetical protein